MKKIIIFISAVLSLVTFNQARAQQVYRRTQFFSNTYLLNPAVAGTQNYMPIFASYRNQWTGFKGAPSTVVLSAHTPMKHNIGLGAIAYNDNTGGAIMETGFEMTGAYKIDLNNFDQVSFGLSLNGSQYKFDNSKLQVLQQDDLALNGGQVESKFNLDATFGFMIYGKQYYFGASAPQLFERKLKLVSNVLGDENRNVRHYNVMGSYRYYIDDHWDIQGSGLLKFTERTPVQMDLNVKLSYNGQIWGGLTARPGDAVAIMFGCLYNNFSCGYSYDFTTSAARALSPHTHELTIGYYIPRKVGRRYNSMGPRVIDRSRIVN